MNERQDHAPRGDYVPVGEQYVQVVLFVLDNFAKQFFFPPVFELSTLGIEKVNLSGQVAALVGFLTQDPSLIWSTE